MSKGVIPKVWWHEFRKNPRKIFEREDSSRLRVLYRPTKTVEGQRDMLVYLQPLKEEEAVEEVEELRCDLCDDKWHSPIFVVPASGGFPPGYYCWRCRQKYDIVDVKDTDD